MSDNTPLTDELLNLSLVQVRGYSRIFHGKPVAVRPSQRSSAPGTPPSASQGLGTTAPKVSVGKAPVGRKSLPTGAAKAVASAQANAATAASKAATAAAKLKAAQQAASNKATAQQLALQTAQLRAATNAQILKNRLAVSNAKTAAALAKTKQQQQTQQQKKAKTTSSKTGGASGTGSTKSTSSPKMPKLGGLLGGALLGRGLGRGGNGRLNRHPLLRHAGGLFIAGRRRNSGSSKVPKSSQEKANIQKASQKLVSPKELEAAERALHMAAEYRKAHGRGKHRVPLDFHEKLALSSPLPDFDPDLFDLQGGLALYGYPVQVSGRMDVETADSLESYLNACLEEEEDAGADI